MRKRFYIFAYCLLFCAHCFPQRVKIDSLLNVLSNVKDDTNRVNTLNALSFLFLNSSKYDSSLIYAGEAKELSDKILYKKGLANSYNNIGGIYWYKGDYAEALKSHFMALKIRKEIANKKGIAASYNNIGLIYGDQGNYPEALTSFFAALKINEEIGNKIWMASNYNNIGIVYDQQGSYAQALKNHFASLKIKKEIGDKEGVAYSYNNIGEVYRMQQKYSEALENYFAAIKIYIETDDQQSLADSYNNIGIIYEKQNNYSEAVECLFKTLKISNKIQYQKGIASAYVGIGSVYLKQSESADKVKIMEAADYLNKGLILAQKLGNKDLIKDAYGSLVEVYSAQNNYKQAYMSYKFFIDYRDSLLNAENTKRTVQVQMQYDFDKKQTADSVKNFEQAKQESLKHEQEIKQQKIYTYGGIVGFILMLVVAGVSFRAFRQKQKANIIIAIQKEIVEEKQKEILDSIHYAKRIQRSLLPTEKYIYKKLKELSEKSKEG